MESNLSYRALIALTVTTVMAGAAAAKGSPEEIEKLGKSLTCIGAEKAGTAPMSGMEHKAIAGMASIAEGPSATPAQIVAMTVLTLLALSAGIIVATIGGRWTM